MKKYLIALVAVVAAFGAMSFNTNSKTDDMYVFEFDASNSYSEANVENQSNWTFVGVEQSLCNGVQGKACRLAVEETYVDNPSSTPTLKSGLNIQAQITTTKARVTSIAGQPANLVSNQPE